MEDTLYDEFGNYCGPELDDDSDEGEGLGMDDNLSVGDASTGGVAGGEMVAFGEAMEVEDEDRIVLHEDKKYYPEADEVYGEGVRTMVEESDTQGLEEPIVKPTKKKKFTVLEGELPELKYSNDFLGSLLTMPELVRNVAVIGQLHHGKTRLMDALVAATHESPWAPGKEVRYTDTRKDEQERELSIKLCPVSLVLEALSGKSHLLNFMDCPGHVNFNDEVSAGLRAADGVLVVVDAVEGVMHSTVKGLRRALSEGLAITLCISKMDRLILEMKLPPTDAYYKLLHTIEEVNTIIKDSWGGAGEKGKAQTISPAKGNVCFASGLHGWSFTLESFTARYCQRMGKAGHKVDPGAMASRMWGDWYMDPKKGAFTKKRPCASSERTFVEFILNPLYKMYSTCVGEEPAIILKTLKKEGVVLTADEVSLDTIQLFPIALGRFFGLPRGLVSMLVQCVPAPCSPKHVAHKLEHAYAGDSSSGNDLAAGLRACDPQAPLCVQVVKMLSHAEGDAFACLGRIWSGRLSMGSDVHVLGERYSEDDGEDMASARVLGLSIPCGRFSVEVEEVGAGNLVLIEGIDGSIRKTATVVDTLTLQSAIFRPLAFDNAAVLKLAVEPRVPSELPKMLEAMRRVSKSYPLVTTLVEESGEHVIMATGELAMDCVMHDLRHLHADMEIRVADPSVCFRETVVDTSSMKCYAQTPNGLNKLTLIAEPLDDGLGLDIEGGHVPGTGGGKWDRRSIGKFFQEEYDWDLMAASRVWAFGPEEQSPNLLLDDTLPGEVDKGLLGAVRDNVIQGFRWGCREGPLCDEPVRNVKFKILDASLATGAIQRGAGQIIPAARRATYSSMLMATPRIMEPVYVMQVQGPADNIDAVSKLLARRRGHVVSDVPKPGSPFYVVRAYVPVIESFGLETDLRILTQGQAFCQQVFDHWTIVPGDPLDRDVVLHPLEPSPEIALAKDFVTKTRRRKGLPDTVSVARYVDDESLLGAIRSSEGNGALHSE